MTTAYVWLQQSAPFRTRDEFGAHINGILSRKPNDGYQVADDLMPRLEAALTALRAPAAPELGGLGDRLAEACKALDGTELWVDDNSPWRIMLKRNGSNVAVAEQHPDSAHGDGEWADGNAICAIVNEAIRSRTTAPSLPVDAGEGRVPNGWKLVPEDPDNEMRAAAHQVFIDEGMILDERCDSELNIWSAMLAAAPQPPVASPALDAPAAGVLVEIEALEGTAAKIRRGASGYRVAAWVEMSVRGLRAAIAQAETGKAGASEPGTMTQEEFDQNLAEVNRIWAGALAPSSETEPQAVGNRRTFVVPPGYEAIRDADNRATGELRLVAPTPETDKEGASEATEECQKCGRTVFVGSPPVTGFLASCGRRLAKLSECRADGCNAPSPEPSRHGVEAMRAALEWYADRSNYPDRVAGIVGVVGTPIMRDVGYRARAALPKSTNLATGSVK